RLDRRAHLDDVMQVTRVKDVRDRVIANLSKGYRQRIGIAQALVGNPKIIILDEPTIGLDPKQIIEIRNLIRNLGRNHTVILSTHILSEVQAVCDRIVIINAGRIVADEKAENIARTVEEIRRYNFTVAGPQREVLRVLRGVPGVAQVEVFGARVDDAYTYTVTADHGLDVRKPVFRALADASYPIVGLEAVQAGLEEIFVRLTDRK
ncbi:MAG: ATP-binding cassette domain-containing protein, partial [Lachnospiraceae bacterium]